MRSNRQPTSSPSERSILIVAGEISGEMYAAELVDALQAKAGDFPVHFFGYGGAQMRRAGVDTLLDIQDLQELEGKDPRLLESVIPPLLEEARDRHPCLAILVDFATLNLRLATQLKTRSIPVIYFICPQFWAWQSDRVHAMKEIIDCMLVILPFEKDFYARYGIEADYIGHPLVDRVKTSLPKQDFFQKHKLNVNLPTISLMPGSRTKEIRHNMPILLETAQHLLSQEPMQFLLPLASSLNRTLVEDLRTAYAPQLPLKIIMDDNYNTIGHSDLAVVCSGTATLETGLLETPLITIYKVSEGTWSALKCNVNVPFVSLVNLVAGKKIIPELLQDNFNVERLSAEIRKYLDSPTLMAGVKHELRSMKSRLGDGGAIQKAAEKIWQKMQHGGKTGAPAI